MKYLHITWNWTKLLVKNSNECYAMTHRSGSDQIMGTQDSSCCKSKFFIPLKLQILFKWDLK